MIFHFAFYHFKLQGFIVLLPKMTFELINQLSSGPFRVIGTKNALNGVQKFDFKSCSVHVQLNLHLNF